MSRVKWLDRTLLSGPYLALCLDERSYLAECRRIGVAQPDPWVTPGSDATTHSYQRVRDGATLCVVCVKSPGRSRNVRATLLVHEAVHVWQHAQKDALLDGDETEAYAVQNIALSLMEEYDRLTKRRPRR